MPTPPGMNSRTGDGSERLCRPLTLCRRRRRASCSRTPPRFKDAPPAPAFCSVVPAARTPQQRAVAANFGHASDQASLGQYGNGTIDATGVWTGGRSRLRPPSVPDWFVCLTGLSILTMLLMPRGARMTLALVHAALCLGCVAYLARLLYLYLYGFRNYEAVRVISFGRYATPMVSGLGPRHHRCAGTGGTGKTTPVRGFRDRVDPLGRVEWNAGSAASQPVGVSDRARGRSLLGHVPDSLRGRCERREPICAALRENRHKDSDIEVGRCPSQPLTDT